MKLISINIERDKHLNLVEAFLKKEQPDVVCVQELLEADIEGLSAILGPCFFVPSTQIDVSRGRLVEGVGIFSGLPMSNTEARQYYGKEGELGVQTTGSAAEFKVRERRYSVALVTVQNEAELYRVATTHFPWTMAGAVSADQRAALGKLRDILQGEELTLCGDFNAPRGGEIFSALATRWHDNIPDTYHTSLDLSLHKAGKIDSERLATLMVDGLFTTPGYRTSRVELVSGVSDHCAIVADVAYVTEPQASPAVVA